jgi:hypothetical protein
MPGITTVLVEPDDAAAWIGLAGVVVGALLTAAFEWVRGRRGDRKRVRRDLLIAGWQLQRRAELLLDARGNWESSPRVGRGNRGPLSG